MTANTNEENQHKLESDNETPELKPKISTDLIPENDREKFLCQDISPELCKELRERKFTDKKADVFLEVRKLEEEYRFLIRTTQDEWNKEIEKTREKWQEIYKKSIKNKQREINKDIKDLEEEVEKSLKALEIQENMIISQINMLYKINRPKLTEDALKILGLNYLCLDKN